MVIQFDKRFGVSPIKIYEVQNMKFSFKDFFSKCDQICSLLRIWSQLLKQPFMENFNLKQKRG